MNNKRNINIGEKMNKIFLAVTLAVFSVSISFGAFSSNDKGTSAAQFLKLGAGARAAAMGDAASALSSDSTDIYWNPAGLSNITGKGSMSVMHAVWFEDISYDWASYAMPYKNWGVFGLGVQYLSYGNIKKADNTGLETGDFSPTDLCVSLSYARNIKGIALGANAKYISQKITNSAVAYAVDLGAQYKTNDKLTLGLAVQNIGTKIKFVNEEDPLPFNVKVGGAYALKDNWLAVLDINAPIDSEVNVGAGTEYNYKIKEKLDIFGRAGYNTRNIKTGGLNGLTTGVGIKYMDYSFDYAFVPYGKLGNTQRLSLSIKF